MNGNNYTPHSYHDCIDAFMFVEEDPYLSKFDKEWLDCPKCGLKPKIWTYDNGRQTACGCYKKRYDYFSVRAESISSIVIRNKGNSTEYDFDDLRKEWNKYCRGENYMTHEKLRKENRW